MEDAYSYRSSDAGSAYCNEANPLQGTLDDLNHGQWPMERSYSAFTLPQQQGVQHRPAFGHRLSVPQNIPLSTHRSPRQNPNQHVPSLNNAMGNSFTGAHSAPILGYLNDPSGPYSAGQSRIQNTRLDADHGFHHYRDPAQTHSDLASDDLPALTIGGDSAYASQVPPSVYSDPRPLDRPNFQHPDNVVPSQLEDTHTVSERSGHSRPRTSRSATRRHYQVKNCPHCNKEPKCESDYKKHMLTHEKHWRCDVPGCNRQEAFGTVNDLLRHKRSVHKHRTGGRLFRCVGKNCDKPDKLWPRFDNFKQHIIRIHKDEHNQDPELIDGIWKRSELHEAKPSPSKVVHNEVMLATDLAGIGHHQPQTMDPVNMYNPMTSDILSQAAAEAQPIQDGLQGTGHLHYPSAYSPTSDRLTKAGQTYSLNTTSADRQGRAIHKRRRYSSPDNAIAVLAHAALNPRTADAKLHTSNAGKQRHMQRSSSRQSNSETTRGTDDDKGQLDALIAQLKSKIGREGLFETLKKASDDASTHRRKRSSLASSVASASITHSGGHKCRTCQKVIARACDLKKHEKRHSKPYGCTFPRCSKVFGSKNDWKRHENSQHFQQEMWRCQWPNGKNLAPDGKCGLVTWHARVLKRHLKKEHNVHSEQDQTHWATNWRIGRSGHTRYWCGYCRDIIPVEGSVRGQAAWDERFNHIDNHIKAPEGRQIHDWLCIETRQTKGESDNQSDKAGTTGSAAVAMPVDDSSSEDESVAPAAPPILSLSQSAGPSTVGGRPMSLGAFSDSRMSSPGPLSRGDLEVYCCQCSSGPFVTGLTTRCMSMTMNETCDHEFCERCYDYR